MKLLPENYEICKPHDATHVWITGRGMLCKIHVARDSTMCAEVPTGEPNYFSHPALHSLKLTTDFEYCRKRKPLVVTDEFIVGKASVDQWRCFDKFSPGMFVRVTIEEVLPE